MAFVLNPFSHELGSRHQYFGQSPNKIRHVLNPLSMGNFKLKQLVSKRKFQPVVLKSQKNPKSKQIPNLNKKSPMLSKWLVKTQCARTDLNKRFLPKPMTTTGWKGTPWGVKITMNWNPPRWVPIYLMIFENQKFSKIFGSLRNFFLLYNT